MGAEVRTQAGRRRSGPVWPRGDCCSRSRLAQSSTHGLDHELSGGSLRSGSRAPRGLGVHLDDSGRRLSTSSRADSGHPQGSDPVRLPVLPEGCDSVLHVVWISLRSLTVRSRRGASARLMRGEDDARLAEVPANAGRTLSWAAGSRSSPRSSRRTTSSGGSRCPQDRLRLQGREVHCQQGRRRGPEERSRPERQRCLSPGLGGSPTHPDPPRSSPFGLGQCGGARAGQAGTQAGAGVSHLGCRPRSTGSPLPGPGDAGRAVPGGPAESSRPRNGGEGPRGGPRRQAPDRWSGGGETSEAST